MHLDQSPRWLELLVNGLTFDIVGLAPGQPMPMPARAHAVGLPPEPEMGVLEAVALRPGPHLAEGGAMKPVLRALAGLAAHLATLPGVRAVAWPSARTWCEPGQYRDTILRWTEGGAFPAFCLAALAPAPDGGMQSEGLALFTGQELRIEPGLARDRAAAGKIGIRLLHWLSERGRIARPLSLEGPDGVPLRLEPSANRRYVRVWRG